MAQQQQDTKKLGLIALASVVVSSMVGGGIFSLPQNMAAGASVGAVILAWVITGFGMYFMANSFRILSDTRPDLTAGIYMYAREGFGPFMGFTIGWGYWLCQIFGNVGYAVITMDALNYFFPPYFQGGNNLYSIIGGSLLIWFFNFVVLRGVRQASFINIIATIFKLIPLALFIIIMAFVFKAHQFDVDFWGNMASHAKGGLGDISTQIKSTMLVTLWSFIGIEGAVVLSSRAEHKEDVGKATFIGFLGCLLIYILLSVLPYGFLSQPELAAIPNPSTAGVLEKVVGPWGSWMMNIGLLIAVLASWLAWTMVTAEIPFAAAQNGTFPKAFAKENENNSPSVSLWTTSALMQLAILMVYFSNNAWNTMLSITGVMVLPAYLSSMAYLWKLCEDGEYPKTASVSRFEALISGVFACIYSVWLIYAAGLQYLLMAILFLAVGIPVFIWARRQNNPGEKVFTERELWFAWTLVIVSVVAIFLFSRGVLSI
ncbi:MAG: amino acid permease [Alphaproteobacteria bacterium]